MTSHARSVRQADHVLALSTLAALLVLPGWSDRHLTDPSFWGLVGFAALAVRLILLSGDSWAPGSRSRGTVVVFLFAVPVVYLADWLRFGGSPAELVVQGVGVALWWFLAARARRSDRLLWLGCILHALWDAGHFGRVDFVPSWYAAGCLAADLGLGAYVLLKLRDSSPRPPD